jgi:hypothetical protein
VHNAQCQQLREAIKVIEARVAERILDTAYSGKMPHFESLLDPSDEMLLKRFDFETPLWISWFPKNGNA